ncbi:MAG: hypothetical protein SFU86_14690 [Pirellulaceae bacterium]|nr:hypothetical protein [Pirellulaceae bacterium]
MSRPLRRWTACLALASAPLLGGCGESARVPPVAEAEVAVPGRFAFPAGALPLAGDVPARDVAQTGGRIVALHPQLPAEESPAIREPGSGVEIARLPVAAPLALDQPAMAQAATEQPASPPRSQFIPLDQASVLSSAAPAAAPSASQFVPVAEVPAAQRVATVPASPPSPELMLPVAQRATQMAQQAYADAQRGMLFSARADLVQSLQLVARALDAHSGTTQHTAALAAGLTALREARDFAPLSSHDASGVPMAEIARTHKTPVLRGAAGGISPVAAQQQYYSFAHRNLVAAVGGEPSASQALFALGKLQTAIAGQSADTETTSGAQAMTFYQAALTVDGRNYLAANELGVLLAQYGQLPAARSLLLHSVNTRPHQEGWHNLAIVHRRLGETELARLAELEQKRLAERVGPATRDRMAANLIRWVDPTTFARASGPEANPPQVAARSSADSNIRR